MQNVFSQLGHKNVYWILSFSCFVSVLTLEDFFPTKWQCYSSRWCHFILNMYQKKCEAVKDAVLRDLRGSAWSWEYFFDSLLSYILQKQWPVAVLHGTGPSWGWYPQHTVDLFWSQFLFVFGENFLHVFNSSSQFLILCHRLTLCNINLLY